MPLQGVKSQTKDINPRGRAFQDKAPFRVWTIGHEDQKYNFNSYIEQQNTKIQIATNLQYKYHFYILGLAKLSIE